MTESRAPDLNKRDIRQRRSLVAQTTLRLFGRTGAVVGAFWIGVTAFLAVWAPLLANSRPLAWKVNDPGGLGVGWQFPAFEVFTPQDVMFIFGFLLLLVCGACYRAGSKVFWFWLATMCAVVVGAMAFYLIKEQSVLAEAITTERNKYARDDSSANLRALLGAQRALLWWWVRWVFLGLCVLGLFALSIAKLVKHKPWLFATLGVCACLLGLLLMPPLRIEPIAMNAQVKDEVYRQAIADGRAEAAFMAPIPYSPNDDLPDYSTVNAKELVVGVQNTFKPPGAHPTEIDIAQEMNKQAEDLYGVRLYSLTDEQGEPIPIPKTREDARAASALLWQAHREKPDYVPARGRSIHANAQALLDRFDQVEAESRTHLMGTTASGKDLASRMIHGSRIALYIGFISTGIAVFIGVIVGGLLGYFAGWVDLIGLRLVEIFASIPVIMLLIMIVAFYGRSLVLMMVVIGLTGWVGYAYFVRAEFLKLRKMDYVMAARASGTPLHLILFKHMLPNGLAPVLVAASFGVAGGIMTEATLSFIGLGLEAGEPSWGQMLDQARKGGFKWWLAIFPGLAIFLTVFAYNLIGEALRDVIDPRAAT